MGFARFLGILTAMAEASANHSRLTGMGVGDKRRNTTAEGQSLSIAGLQKTLRTGARCQRGLVTNTTRNASLKDWNRGITHVTWGRS